MIPDKIDEEETQVAKKFGVFGATLITFFLAEMGDKTQIATIAMAAHYAAPLMVVIGTTLGMLIAEKIDRISRLPLPEAEKLVSSIRSKGARLAVPGLVDLSEITARVDGIAKIVLASVQELLLKLSLQMARDNYETRRERQRQGVQLAKHSGKYKGRKEDSITHQRIIALRDAGNTIHKTAELAGCSVSQVKRIWAINQSKKLI